MNFKPEQKNGMGLLVLGIGFVLLSVGFVIDPWGKVDPIKENKPIDARFLAHKTVRDPLLKPVLKKIGYEYNCNSCHQHFDISEKRNELVAEHTNIKLSHGLNHRCLNCHSSKNWERLIDHDGTEFEFSSSEFLCRKCHGPKYRDWLAGAHGRPNGYWDQSKGESIKTTCVACHDPHAPKFKPLEPAPAPRERIRAKEPKKEGSHG